MLSAINRRSHQLLRFRLPMGELHSLFLTILAKEGKLGKCGYPHLFYGEISALYFSPIKPSLFASL